METTTLAGAILVDSREAARRLAISTRTLFTLTAEGTLPACKIRRAVRYRIVDLEAFAERQANGTPCG